MANKKCLVYETLNKISDLKIINESNDGFMRLHGVFGVCGVKNNNNRIYDKKNYGMMVETLQQEITQGSVLGELEHPSTMNITLENVSHMIESIEMNEDGTITGTIKILDTPKGRIAKAIAEASGSLYISSRGAGSIDESGHVTLTTIKTYDLVGTPGFSQAKLNLQKGQKFESLNESLEDGPISWMIVEGDDDKDDLLSTDNDKKDNGDDVSTQTSDAKSDDTKPADNKDDNKDDNNKNNDKDATMNELKEAIDKLTERVESLQADLHVAQESLTEKDNQIKALTEKLDNLEIPEAVKYEAIENWVKNEFAPEFTESLTSSISESVMGDVKESIDNATTAIAEGVQNWTVNEFAPEVQNWVCEEFAPEVQNWVCEEFAPTVEGWINEELMPTVDKWINEECIPEHKELIINEVNNNVSEFLESKNADKLTSIDNLLEAIEGKNSNVDNALQLLNESQVDSKFKGVYVVENMPAQYMPQWTMLSEAKQNDIIRRSRMYDFTKPGIMEKFWDSVDFNESTQPIVENQATMNDYHANIFKQMRKLNQGF